MAEQAKHTPTPWKALCAHVYRAGEDGANVCSASDPHATTTVGYTEVDVGSEGLEEAHENAAFIVRACNAHGVLVAVLQDFVAPYKRLELDDAFLTEIAGGKPGAVRFGKSVIDAHVADAILAARTALALATESQS